MMNTDDDEQAARTPVDRRAAISSGAVAVALLAGAAWWGWGAAHQPVRWRDVGYQILSATEATSTFDVFIYEDVDVTCHLRALNARFSEVGVGEALVRVADGREQRLTATLTTVEPAVTAVVAYCEPVRP